MPSAKDLLSASILIVLAIVIFVFATYIVTIVIPILLIAGLVVVVAAGIKHDREEGP